MNVPNDAVADDLVNQNFNPVISRALNIPKYLISIINILIYAVQIDQKMLK
jgi:hypothetical protein